MKARGISLANKCQLLFGAAVVLILTAALAVPWMRLERMIERGERGIAQQLADAWLQNVIILGTVPETGVVSPALTQSNDASANAQNTAIENAMARAGVLRIEALDPARAELRIEASNDSMLRRALDTFRENPEAEALFETNRSPGRPVRYRYMRSITAEELAAIQDPGFARLEPNLPNPAIGNPLRLILVIERSAVAATGQLFINRTYIVLSGIFAGFLAILVFYFITTRLIISPVRVLRDATERVSRGDLNVRSDIATGDEFEELSDMFNQMLASLKSTQDQLRQMNKSLDLKLADLARSNVMLLESNRLKSEFLANVSHELRTPLNSIIGFAEVIAELDGQALIHRESDSNQAAEKQKRYINNILVSGRNLLQMINDLLDLARIEAGRVEVQTELINVIDMCESLATLIGPQADRKHIRVNLNVSPTLPMVETDPGKFQQIIFNFLSNAIKFTPEHGDVTLTARRWRDRATTQRESTECIQVSVEDTGPGISEEDQKLIFEKFRQVDASHTRQHQGTGLGLAICRELAILLGGTIEVESRIGTGSKFNLILPVKRKVIAPQALMPGSTNLVEEIH